MEFAKRYGVLYVLLLTLTHCAGADIDPSEARPDCKRFRCEAEAVKYTPEQRLLATTDGVLRRFNAATGRTDLGIANEGGVPVLLTEHLIGTDPTYVNEDGSPKEVCALTTAVGMPGARMFTQKIEIDPTPPEGCPNIWLSLLHETIHSLAPNVQHAATGVFAPVIEQPMNGAKAIDEAALVQLCSEFRCNDFVPEL